MDKMSKKKPWIAALLNLLFWGLGYIYNGKRKVFGVMLFISVIALSIVTMLPSSTSDISNLDLLYVSNVSDYGEISNLDTSNISDYGGITSFFYIFLYLIPIAFAYDGYKEAQEINQRK
jgi:hypothetical protein